ncbi:MAG: TetR/AcrR family transcriptional regulator [Pseudomonadota bacterium]
MAGSRYKKSAQTQERLLDAAEELFALQGFDVTTTRQITEKAGVRNASVNYYFETKHALGVAVLARRFDVLRVQREARLAEVEPGQGAATLRAIVNAFVLPLAELTRSGGQGWANYNRIVAQLSASGAWPKDDYVEKVNSSAAKFVSALHMAFPEATLPDIIRGYQFMLGAVLLSFAETRRFAEMSSGLIAPEDVYERPEMLVEFLVGGLSRMLGETKES